MIEQEINGCQVLSNGERVWVNGTQGESLARLGRFGATVMIDIHQRLTAQRSTGRECLDCRNDLRGAVAWHYFVSAVERHFNLTLSEEHRPRWAVPSRKSRPI